MFWWDTEDSQLTQLPNASSSAQLYFPMHLKAYH